ncbi:MFS transporter [Streptomyces sp. DSM 42041]|uniref:MFS transporter n=1 Tax=Streptomyces hazeniae TaxID=3075538 RepID=A0ABU2NPW8_9ACTN|nr:MFS transporter [Streptomyces sp. DSM 42041]MDT0379018.1 MFS transporter [Streptomyces sp. DSM 42041]
MDRRFRALLCAHAVSAYGNYLNLIALSLFAYEVAGGALGVGVVMAVRLSSGFVAGLAAGRISDRTGRRALMIGTDVAQAAAMTVLALSAGRTPLLLLAGAVVVMGAGHTLFTVALRSAVPVMVGQDRRREANGLLVTLRSFATVLGFASATPVIALGGYTAAFAVNAASFAVSAAALVTLRPRTDEADPGPGAAAHGGAADAGTGAADADAPKDAATDATTTWRALAAVPAVVLAMVALRGADALSSASHNVALPVLAQQTAPSQPALLMTQFWSAWAVGTLVAHQVVKRRKEQRGAAGDERGFASGTVAMSLFFVAAFTGLPGIALMLVALCAGLADGYTEIVYTSRLQAAPDRLRSRLFGASAVAETAGFTLGAVAAAAALEALPVWVVVGAFHAVAACGGLALLLFRTSVRASAPTTPEPATPTAPPAAPACTPTDSATHPATGPGDEGENPHGARTRTGPLPGA